MKDVNDNKSVQKAEEQKSHFPSPVGLGILGALTGAAFGTVAAIYLSESKNRSQLKKQVVLFRDRIIKVMDSLSEQEIEQEISSSKLDDISEEVHTTQR